MPIFMALISVFSIIAFIQIATKTSILQITLLEMVEIYLYGLPEILFYVLPVSFSSAIIIGLSKSSMDLEFIALFAIKTRGIDIMKPLFFVATILTASLLLIGFVLKPVGAYKRLEFAYKKEDSTKLNIEPSKFGQSFGKWMIFASSADERNETQNIYNNIVLFSSDTTETFVRADSGVFGNKDGAFSLTLRGGEAYSIKPQELEMVSYDKLVISESSKLEDFMFEGVVSFWKKTAQGKYAKDITYTILTALSPFLFIPISVAFGIFNPRLAKNHSGFYSFGVILSFYMLVFIVGKQMPFLSIIVVPMVWFVFSMIVYRNRLKHYV